VRLNIEVVHQNQIGDSSLVQVTVLRRRTLARNVQAGCHFHQWQAKYLSGEAQEGILQGSRKSGFQG